MKQTILMIAIATQILGTIDNRALAGPGTSGGGFAVVCRSPANNQIQNAQLLDLFEATERYGLVLIPSTGIFTQDYLLAVKNTFRLQGSDDVLVGQETRENLKRFEKLMHFTRPEESLPKINDLGKTVPVPVGCQIEQVALFDDQSQTVAIDSSIWSAFDSQSKAALVHHELLYREYRTFAEDTSENTRASVAHIYSTNATPVHHGLPKQTIECMGFQDGKATVFEFWGRTSAPFEFIFQFSHLLGRPMFNKAIAHIPDLGMILKNSNDNLNPLILVAEFGQDKVRRVKIEGSQSPDLELEITYVSNKPLKMGLLQAGVLLDETLLRTCKPRNH